LYDSILSNAKSSAFHDPRFSPLTKDELENNDLFIEITILSEIQEKQFSNIKELLQFLRDNKP
jgi:AMMECR1 domain-containing protein